CDLHSFPTRRSSDLKRTISASMASRLCRSSTSVKAVTAVALIISGHQFSVLKVPSPKQKTHDAKVSGTWASELYDSAAAKSGNRSEEHTSELQSRFD